LHKYPQITRVLYEFSIPSERLSLIRDAAGAESARLMVELALKKEREEGREREREREREKMRKRERGRRRKEK